MDIKQIIEQMNPSKKSLVWLLGIAITAIGVAFVLGGKWVNNESKISSIDENVVETKELLIKTNNRIDSLQKTIDTRFEDAYQKGSTILEDYQQSMHEQIQFIIDYREEDKKLLKQALKLQQESTKEQLDRNIERAMKTNTGVKQNDNTNNKKVTIEEIEDYQKLKNINKKQLDELRKKNKILKVEELDNGNFNVTYISL